MSTLRNENFRGTADALCKILFGDTATARETAVHLDRENLWPRIVDVASLWKVIPRLRQRMDAPGLVISPEQRERLRNLSIAEAAQTMLVAHRGGTAANRLIHGGVQAAAFKGVGLLANLYDHPGARSVGDMDLLINGHDLFRACGVLDELGFRPQVSVPLKEWLAHIKNRIHPTHGYVVFEDDDGVEIDLHWHLGIDRSGKFSTRAVIERAEKTTLLGIPIKAVAPLDAMMLTVHHTIRNYFRPWTTVKDLCDLSAWWRVEPERWQVEDSIEYAVDGGLSKALLGLWAFLIGLDKGHPAVRGVETFSRVISGNDRIQALQLRDLFKLQLHEEALDPLLVGMFSFSPNTLKRYIVYEKKVKTKKDAFRKQEARKRGAILPFPIRIYRIIRTLTRLTPRRLAMYRTALRQRMFFQAIYEEDER